MLSTVAHSMLLPSVLGYAAGTSPVSSPLKTPPSNAVDDPRNVALIVVDDLRTDLAHTTDQQVVTPNLLKFANDAASVTLDGAYIQQGVCSPSRNSFLTGRTPDVTQVGGWMDRHID